MRLIDADDLLTAFPIDDEPTVTIACIRATIKHMPTIEERKKGEWIDDKRQGFDGTFHWFRKCDQCDYERTDDNPDNDSNFCPNCGAYMRGGNHE